MPVFKIHRLRDSAQEHFRWAPHTAGVTQVRAKDYREEGQIEAPSPYTAWARLREAGTPLRVGDLLEMENGELRVCKYVGIEDAQWAQPEAAAAEGVPGVTESPAAQEG